jgi:twitching motility two-component system response regulator PilH
MPCVTGKTHLPQGMLIAVLPFGSFLPSPFRRENVPRGLSTPMMNPTPNDTPLPASTILHAPPCAQRATVLLAEDDRSIRRYLEIILQRAGFEVIAAADGLEAMKAALSSAIDAVVTDAIMPHLNGYELCRFVRRHPKLARLPIVLLSGVEHAAESGDAGEHPDVYLSKPIRPEELTTCLSRLLVPTN